MINYFSEITATEIKELAKKRNQTYEEVCKELQYALKDLEYTELAIQKIISKNGYVSFPQKIDIHGYGKSNELNTRYMCSDNIENLNYLSAKDLAIVTGFGPTNAPTAGTLSMIFRAIEMQKISNIYTHIIISDLGAYNSRKMPLKSLFKNTNQFIKFITALGFDRNNGEIRTHNYWDHSRTFSVVASVTTLGDLYENEEVTEQMYQRLNLTGNDFSTMVDKIYTVSDILLPIIRDQKKGVIVSAGLEENYYPTLARILCQRLCNKTTDTGLWMPKDPIIAALYGRLITGLFPYVKMSKSIPESSINIGETEDQIIEKILNCNERNEAVIMQMIELTTNWNSIKVKKAREIFNDREEKPNEWFEVKEEYVDFFLSIRKLWNECGEDSEIDVRARLYQ